MRSIATRFTEVLNFRILMVLAILAGVLAMQSGRGTLAYFTSTASSTSNTFTAGRLNINLSDTAQGGGSAQTADLTDNAAGNVTTTFVATDFVPGDTKTAPLTVQLDTGSIAAFYGLKYTATGATNLTPKVTLEVKVPTALTGATLATQCTAADFTNALLWTAYYGPQAMTATTQTTVINSGASADAAPVKARRAIASGDTHLMCFQFKFVDAGTPGSNTTGDNAAQGEVMTVQFDFDARQQSTGTAG